MSTIIKMDMREFDSALKEYMTFSKKALWNVVNSKAFFICRGAARMTYRANAGKIETELGKDKEAFRVITRGRNAGKLKRVGYSIKKSSAANDILRSRIWTKGGAQPTQKEMAPTIKKFIKARASSSAFIAAGWIPAIKFFAPIASDKRNAPPQDYSVKLRAKREIGGANAAKESWNPVARFWNSAVPKRGTNGRDAVSKFAGEGLQNAMAAEIQSMRQYVSNKLQSIANKHNTRKI